MPSNRPKQKTTKESDPTDTLRPFENLTRKLVIVPKEEIDREEEKYQREKKRRQAKSKK